MQFTIVDNFSEQNITSHYLVEMFQKSDWLLSEMF